MTRTALLLSRLPLFTKAGIPKVNLVYCQHSKSCLKILSPSTTQSVTPFEQGDYKSESIFRSTFCLFNVPFSFAFIITSIRLAIARRYSNLIINIPDPIPQLIMISLGWLYNKKIIIWHANPTPPLDKILSPLLFPSFWAANNIIFFTNSHVESLIKSNLLYLYSVRNFRSFPSVSAIL